jgi:MoCo/4Fe-4S cofactor protein with predicted Tat translocation signal
MDSNKKYWKGLEELNRTPEFVEKNKNEFAEPIPIEEILAEMVYLLKPHVATF